MFRFLRSSHKIVGLVAAIFLLTIAVTGFLLAMKSNVDWIRPPEAEASKSASPADLAPLSTVVESVFALGIPELQEMKQIDRIDYRPKSNIFKVVSKEGYLEIQVDGTTGKVLQRAARTDQLVEDIHDLSFIADPLHKYWLPVVAVILGLLSISGVWMYLIPVFRRMKFKREHPK